MSCTIPKEALESIARALYPDIIAFFESEEGQREYEEWLTNRRRSKRYKQN